jgi:microcystin-dependent protein
LTGGTITSTGTIGINSSSTTNANFVVQRDANGSFSANVITANIALANVTGLGTNVSTFLATPTSANLANALTNETGSGSLVFSTSPTLSSPTIGGGIASLSGYTANNTAALYSNQWTKIATFTTTAQYGGATALIDFINEGSGVTSGARGTLYVRIKQQSALGSAPLTPVLVLYNADSAYLRNSDFSTVVTQNDATATVHELYMRDPNSYNVNSFNPIMLKASSTTVTFLSNQTFSATLPAGTTTTASYPALLGSSANISGQIVSTFAGAPFAVSNTTVVANLNADLLDGFHRDSTSVANTVVSRDANASLSANVISGTTVNSSSSMTVGSTLTVGPAFAGSAGVEVGRVDGTASTPYIDFHSGATATDFDARILASGGTGTSGGGALSIASASVSTTGDFTVGGNLTVNGTTTTINSTTISVDDKNIVLGNNASSSNTTADGGGITIEATTGGDKTWTWSNTTGAWTSSEDINIPTGKVYEVNGTAVLSSTQVLGYAIATGNTVSTVVARDASGNFSAGTITASSLVKSGGTSGEFLKANGSVDSTQYVSQVYFINPPIGITTSSSVGSGIANISFSIDSGYALPLATQLVPTGSIMMWATSTPPDGWLLCEGQSTTGYPALAALVGANVPDLRGRIPVGQLNASSLGTATITIATPGVITATGHGLSAGQQVYLTTTGALPTGLTANTVYYVSTVPSVNTLTLATTINGSPIATSGTQSGTHTLFTADFASVRQTGGKLNHTLTVAEIPSHDHLSFSSTYTAFADAFATGTISGIRGVTGGSVLRTGFTGGGMSHFNIQPYIVLEYIIKT